MRYGGWAQSLALIFLLFHLFGDTPGMVSEWLTGKKYLLYFFKGVFAAKEFVSQVSALDAVF